uniref:Putative secreted protein n=1 Tax=Anopheles darlingi TaxID=43151 RepID=A0A2M4D6T8_ANODA
MMMVMVRWSPVCLLACSLPRQRWLLVASSVEITRGFFFCKQNLPQSTTDHLTTRQGGSLWPKNPGD